MVPALDRVRRILSLSAVALCGLIAALPSAAAAESARTIIILDGSGSMWGAAGNERKLDIARRTVDKVVSQVPPDREVGLMAYGHRRKGIAATSSWSSCPRAAPARRSGRR